MELFKASHQWSTRPNDERFPTLQALYAATKAYAATAGTVERPWADLRVEKIAEDVQITGRANVPARLTHWAFGQLCSKIEAPAPYLRKLPATLAAQNLNHGLAHLENPGVAQMLMHANGNLLVRALTSDIYERIWNYEVAERLLELETYGWAPAKPDIRIKDDAPALYASDHDLFAFVMRNDRVIVEAGNADGLKRGVIVENSEVGASSLRLTRFLYREMCGNHIIWGAQNVVEIAIRHVGRGLRDRLRNWEATLRRYANESASDMEAQIASAKRAVIAATKEDVLDKLFGMRSVRLSRKALEEGYDTQETRHAAGREPDAPNTVWGMVQGLTHYATTIPYADKRTEIDKGAGRLLDITF